LSPNDDLLFTFHVLNISILVEGWSMTQKRVTAVGGG